VKVSLRLDVKKIYVLEWRSKRMRMRKTIWLLLAVLSIAPVAQAADNGLVLWYNYQENADQQAAGVVVDQSTKGNNGTVEEGWSGYGLPTYTAGHVAGSSAMLFGNGDGSTWNNITVPKSTSLAHVGTAFSMGGWIRVDTIGGWGETYPKMFSCPNYELTFQGAGDPASYFWPYAQEANPWGTPGSWDMTMADTGSLQGSWMHVIVTYDGTTLTEYINGASAFTAAGFAHQFDDTVWDDPVKYFNPDTPLKIGSMVGSGYPSGGGWLGGALDDTAIWGNAYLTPEGVAGLYSGIYTPATAPTVIVPEPATMLLIGLGFALIRRKHA
jgi:hypothetical protein